MPQIVSKLNLNKTPSLVESNSLIFAKNIRLDVDGSIHKDYGIFPISLINKVPQNEDCKNLIGRIIHDIQQTINNSNLNPSEDEDYEYAADWYNDLIFDLKAFSLGDYNEGIVSAKNGTYKIVGVIENSNEFYVLINGEYTRRLAGGDISANKPVKINRSYIIRFDEKEDKFSPCNCNWNYNGGVIDGCVINNLRGEKILNIGETNTSKLVPLKCINLSKSTINDDESVYTQTPHIPITNLNYIDDFKYIIPNGVYQFFVRYKIREDFYTNWFPASKELFAGNSNNMRTSFGSIKYINTHRDSDNSFSFEVEHLINDYKKNYQGFQIGFILSHDDSIVARAWKHFDMNISIINFDYDAKDAIEIEVIDLIQPTYQLYNVGNITSFKNKLYISNYTETNFNDPKLQALASKITVDLPNEITDTTDKVKPSNTVNVGGKPAISGLIIAGNARSFSGQDGIFHQLLDPEDDNDKPTIGDTERTDNLNDFIKNVLDGNKDTKLEAKSTKDYVTCVVKQNATLKELKEKLEAEYDYNQKSFKYDDKYEIKFKDSANGSNEPITTVDELIKTICDKPRYLDYNGYFINSNGNISNSFVLVITRKVDISYWTEYEEQPNFGSTGDQIPPDYEAGTYSEITTTFEQELTITFTVDKSNIDFNESYNKHLNSTTLVPYQTYKFYVHYVKDTGEITNGYECGGGPKTAKYMPKANTVIYPSFKNIEIPKDYAACFFSILHVENKVASLFDVTSEGATESTEEGIKPILEGQCLDMNIGLMHGTENIHIIQNEASTSSGKYWYSSDSTNLHYFGAYGIVTFILDNVNLEDLFYVKVNYHLSEADDIQLVKCTPYISEANAKVFQDTNEDKNITDDKEVVKKLSYDKFANMNLLGYICKVNKLDKTRTKEYYTDGSTIGYKTVDTNDQSTNEPVLSLVELKAYSKDTTNDKEKLEKFDLKITIEEDIYSNYNLNYLALVEDPVQTFKSYYSDSSNNVSENTEHAGTKLLLLFKSLTMSSIYELPSMYKNYTRKTYSTYKKDEVVRFENTIRSSMLEGDENYINIFKFHPNDYYNVPTNRGIIVNLISVGDAILVHTKDSMFQFVGSNSLQSADGEIQQVESQPFNTGVSEVFGSDFGFAGIQNKTDSITTENGYIFFDRDSRIIYMYSGQGQITKLSDSIEKLFKHKDIRNVYFANDFYNDRFFMSIIFDEIQYIGDRPKHVYFPVTLSFNFSNNTKAFVSLHDFYYYKAFNTKTKCYFVTREGDDICRINKLKGFEGYYTKLGFTDDRLYPNKYHHDRYGNNFDSIIDVIVNDDFEKIKTLNSVSWCGDVVENEFPDKELFNNSNSFLRLSEGINDKSTCSHMRIYTDTCMTPLLDFTGRSNDEPLTIPISKPNPNSYKIPRYNQGFWTFNYFRNIENSNGHVKPYYSDDNSLIEGKYFVVRFIFDREFKLERMTLNYDNKI